MATKTKFVLIHGTHHALVDNKRVKHEVGAELELHPEELARLDPQFRNGIGERFASPEKAAKLAKKRQLEAELEADEADEGEDSDDAAEPVVDQPDELPESAPTPPAVDKPKKPKKSKA